MFLELITVVPVKDLVIGIHADLRFMVYKTFMQCGQQWIDPDLRMDIREDRQYPVNLFLVIGQYKYIISGILLEHQVFRQQLKVFLEGRLRDGIEGKGLVR